MYGLEFIQYHWIVTQTGSYSCCSYGRLSVARQRRRHRGDRYRRHSELDEVRHLFPWRRTRQLKLHDGKNAGPETGDVTVGRVDNWKNSLTCSFVTSFDYFKVRNRKICKLPFCFCASIQTRSLMHWAVVLSTTNLKCTARLKSYTDWRMMAGITKYRHCWFLRNIIVQF